MYTPEQQEKLGVDKYGVPSISSAPSQPSSTATSSGFDSVTMGPGSSFQATRHTSGTGYLMDIFCVDRAARSDSRYHSFNSIVNTFRATSTTPTNPTPGTVLLSLLP